MNDIKKYYTLIVFDWDGTLYDSSSQALRCLQQSVIDLKYPPFDSVEYNSLSGLAMEQIIETLYMDLPSEKRELLQKRYRFHVILRQKEVLLYPDAKEVLITLSKTYQLAIATNTPSQSLRSNLSALMISDLFAITRTADQTAAKPNPMMLEEIMMLTGSELKHTLMVGDSPLDIQMAKNIGIDAVGVDADPKRRDLLTAEGAIATLTRLKELVDYLGH